MMIINNKYGESCIFDNELGNFIKSKYKPRNPDKHYHSISKLLDKTSDKTGLERWRDRIGHDKADAISEESRLIGSEFDRLMYEHYRHNEIQTSDKTSSTDKMGFRLYEQALPFTKYIEPIAMQLHLYSDKLNLQGYCDCLCYWKGELSILDFKNSKKFKDDKYLDNYYLQCTYYSMIIHDMFGISVKNIVLFIGMRSDVVPDIKTSKVKYFIKQALERRKEYLKLVELDKKENTVDNDNSIPNKELSNE